MKVKRAGLIAKLIILALVIYGGVSILSLTARISQASLVREALQAEVEQMAQTNAELKYQLEHKDDPEAIEEIARNKLGLVRPGEKIFYDVSD